MFIGKHKKHCNGGGGDIVLSLHLAIMTCVCNQFRCLKDRIARCKLRMQRKCFIVVRYTLIISRYKLTIVRRKVRIGTYKLAVVKKILDCKTKKSQ